MTQSLYELARSYDASIESIKSAANETRIRMKLAKINKQKDEYDLLRRKLNICYEEIRDMTAVSSVLKNYYGDEKREGRDVM